MIRRSGASLQSAENDRARQFVSTQDDRSFACSLARSLAPSFAALSFVLSDYLNPLLQLPSYC